MGKLERKRARNREAAARCRKRKLERISNLDERVNELKEENADLASVVKRLRASVCQLKQEVMDHVANGCQINMVAEESGAVALRWARRKPPACHARIIVATPF